jgi:hypothetical protein
MVSEGNVSAEIAAGVRFRMNCERSGKTLKYWYRSQSARVRTSKFVCYRTLHYG